MKTVNKICQVLAILFGLASSVLFFLNFATLTIGGEAYTFTGAQFAFGASKELAGGVVADLAVSTHLLICFILTLIGFVCSILSFKKVGFRYAASGFGLAAAIYVLVGRLNQVGNFLDLRAEVSDTSFIFGASEAKYTMFMLLLVFALFLFTIASVAHLLVSDAIEVAESKGAKKPILKRVALFFRDYKSEAKKIVWPGLSEVAKNTVIVLIMCLIVGALIWIVDFGLGSLIDLILGLKS